jgi:thioredoxin reductase (NADPH)
MKIHDVLIIGGGPAGIAASIQLKRYDIESLIVEKNTLGGLLREANLVENYLGFPEGISGESLANIFKKQIEDYKIKVVYETVISLNFENQLFVVKTDNSIHYSKIVIIASGTNPKISPYEIDNRCKERVHSSIINLKNLTNKEIVIIGAGDAAFDYAINLSKNNKVFIFNRSDRIKSLPLLYKRAMKNKNISYFEFMSLNNVDCNLDKLRLEFYNSKTNEINDFQTDYLLFAIGRVLNLNFVSEDVTNNINEFQKEGLLYLIGDVKNGLYRQTSISVGNGIECAMKINKIFGRNI